MAYRILSLDGGGAWALIQVKALMSLYGADAKGHTVLGEFDLIAANSGGSIVLGGLVENLTLSQLLEYFSDETKRRAIFSPSKSWGDWAIRKITGLGPKYSAANKLPALQRLLPQRGGLPLAIASAGIRRPGSSEDARLLVVAFDYDLNRAKFFRSAASNNKWGKGVSTAATLAEVIHASTNAPVNYFDGPAMLQAVPRRYWDGGITGCNNPVLAAVIEALMLEKKPDEIVALSIGTGTVCLPPTASGRAPYVRKPKSSGLIGDLTKLATSVLDDPPDAATFNAHVMTAGGAGVNPPAISRIVRMNPLISPVSSAGHWTAPTGMTAEAFDQLVNLDMDAVAQKDVDAIIRFADLWLKGHVSNQPIRMDWDTLDCEIGYRSFGDAQAAWSALR
jgi:uncharacterized protein